MISQITIRKIGNGFVAKAEYPQEDFSNADVEEYLRDEKEVMQFVNQALEEGEA